MRSILSLLIALSAVVAHAQAAGKGEQEGKSVTVNSLIRARCAEDHPQDHQLRTACVDSQRTAAKKLQALQNRYPMGTDEWKIVQRCLKEWAGPDFSKAGFVMAADCFDQQYEADEALR